MQQSSCGVLELRWGKLTSREDYEDTERIAAWDAERSNVSTSTGSLPLW